MNQSTFRGTFLAHLFALLVQCAFGQSARQWADSSRVEAGNPYLVHLEAQQAAQPEPPDLTPWHLVLPPSDVLHTSAWQQAGATWRSDVQIILFDSGRVVLPPLTIGASSTDSLAIDVYPLALADTAQLAAINDIILAAPAPPTKPDYALWLSVFLAVLLSIGLAWWLFKRRKKRPIRGNTPLTADVWQQQFEALRQRIPMQPQKPYYDELAWLLRSWLEQKHGIGALERTTSEIVDVLKQSDLSPADKQHVADILQRADMVKFANEEPSVSMQMESWVTVRGVVVAD